MIHKNCNIDFFELYNYYILSSMKKPKNHEKSMNKPKNLESKKKFFANGLNR